jgi:hypothetical protein
MRTYINNMISAECTCESARAPWRRRGDKPRRRIRTEGGAAAATAGRRAPAPPRSAVEYAVAAIVQSFGTLPCSVRSSLLLVSSAFPAAPRPLHPSYLLLVRGDRPHGRTVGSNWLPSYLKNLSLASQCSVGNEVSILALVSVWCCFWPTE